MTDAQKQQVLDFAATQAVTRPPTVDGATFIERTKHLRLSNDDAKEMMSVIDDAFNVVDDLDVNFDD